MVLTFQMKWKPRDECWQPPKMNLTLRQGPREAYLQGWDVEGVDISKMAVTRREGADEFGNAAGIPEQSRAGLAV